MSKTIFTSILLFTVISVSAQNKDSTNATKFAARSGTLVQKEYLTVGKLGDAELSVVNYEDLIAKDRIAALEISIDVMENGLPTTKIGIIDADEMDAFIKAVKTLNSSVLNSRKNNYTEVTFRARSGFEAGCIFTDGAWSGYMMLETGDGASVLFVKPNDFVTLGTFLTDAKGKMKK